VPLVDENVVDKQFKVVDAALGCLAVIPDTQAAQRDRVFEGHIDVVGLAGREGREEHVRVVEGVVDTVDEICRHTRRARHGEEKESGKLWHETMGERSACTESGTGQG